MTTCHTPVTVDCQYTTPTDLAHLKTMNTLLAKFGHPIPQRKKCQTIAALFSLLTLFASALAHAEDPAGSSELQSNTVIRVSNKDLREMSGLAVSHRHPGLLWAHNDSGDAANLYAFNSQGQMAGTLRIENASAIDWEDMDSFKDQQGFWLLVADTGDNFAVRSMVDVYLIREPEILSATGKQPHTKHYSLIYGRGPRDAEAIAVDPAQRFVYLLTKRTRHPELYRFSLDALSDTRILLEYLGEITSLPSPERHAPQKEGGITQYSPTAMSFSPKGDAAIIVTLKKTYYFERRPDENWLDALNRAPRIYKPAALPQIEAGTFSLNGRALLIGSEGQPGKISVLAR
jgi:hypothetical protein